MNGMTGMGGMNNFNNMGRNNRMGMGGSRGIGVQQAIRPVIQIAMEAPANLAPPIVAQSVTASGARRRSMLRIA